MSEKEYVFRPVIALWGALGELATDMGEPYATVQQWHWRDSIPTAHFPKLIQAARQRALSEESEEKRRAFSEITLDRLVSLAGQRSKRKAA